LASFVGGAPKNDVAVEGNGVVPKLVVVPNGVVIPNVVEEKLGVAPKLKPPVLKPVPVVLGDEKPNPVEGAKVEAPKPEPKVGVVPEVAKELVGANDPNPPPNAPPPAGANEVPKLGVVPNEGVAAVPKEKGEVELPNMEPVVPNEPNAPVVELPNGLVPKLVVGVELNEPNPELKAGVVVGVVPKELPKVVPKGEGEGVLPNELVELPKAKGLLLVEAPNIPPEPMAVPVPKGELDMVPNGLGAPIVPKPLVEAPKGEAAGLF
jgi:hypothetical protein